ncbi:hypothetical protein ACQUY5_29290 [Bacillus cereus]|uniref:hypothetical protein n=1 Tax=Bacillus cereus TaxID=1396 RepID=UPI003D167B53
MYKDIEVRLPNEENNSYFTFGFVRTVQRVDELMSNPLLPRKSILNKNTVVEIVKEDWKGDDYVILLRKSEWFGKEGDLYVLDSNDISQEDIETGYIVVKPYKTV